MMMGRWSLVMVLMMLVAVRCDDDDVDDDRRDDTDDVDYRESHVVADPSEVVCGSHEFLDTIDLRCTACALMGDSNLVADRRYTDGVGNALRCRCPMGFVESSDAEACDIDGRCEAVRCESCAALGFDTSYSDLSGCVSCGNSTSGVDGKGGDCGCGSHARLVERDFGEALLGAKECVSCAHGRFVQQSSGFVAGACDAGWHEGAKVSPLKAPYLQSLRFPTQGFTSSYGWDRCSSLFKVS